MKITKLQHFVLVLSVILNKRRLCFGQFCSNCKGTCGTRARSSSATPLNLLLLYVANRPILVNDAVSNMYNDSLSATCKSLSKYLRKCTVSIDVVGILSNKCGHVIRRNVLQLTPDAVSCNEMILRSKNAAVANE